MAPSSAHGATGSAGPAPEHHVELSPDSHNPEHQPIKIDLARQHILHIDGVAVRALIGRLGSACQ